MTLYSADGLTAASVSAEHVLYWVACYVIPIATEAKTTCGVAVMHCAYPWVGLWVYFHPLQCRVIITEPRNSLAHKAVQRVLIYLGKRTEKPLQVRKLTVMIGLTTWDIASYIFLKIVVGLVVGLGESAQSVHSLLIYRLVSIPVNIQKQGGQNIPLWYPLRTSLPLKVWKGFLWSFAVLAVWVYSIQCPLVNIQLIHHWFIGVESTEWIASWDTRSE